MLEHEFIVKSLIKRMIEDKRNEFGDIKICLKELEEGRESVHKDILTI